MNNISSGDIFINVAFYLFTFPNIVITLHGLYSVIFARFRFFSLSGRVTLGVSARMAGLVIMLMFPLQIVIGMIVVIHANIISINEIQNIMSSIYFPSQLTSWGITYLIACLIALSSKEWEQRGKRNSTITKMSLTEAANYLGLSKSQTMALVTSNKLLAKYGSDGQPFFFQDTLLSFKENRGGNSIPTISDPPVETLPQQPSQTTNAANVPKNDPVTPEVQALLRRYSIAISENSQDPDLYFQRAKLFHKISDRRGAAGDFKRVLALQTDHPQAENMKQYIATWGLPSPSDPIKNIEGSTPTGSVSTRSPDNRIRRK